MSYRQDVIDGKIKKIGHVIDLSGMKFGKLTAVELTDERKSSHVVWKCKCDCGNIRYVTSQNLRNGCTTNCGCARRADIAGKKFGILTAISIDHIDKKHGGTMWLCRCDCGNEIVLRYNNLVQAQGIVGCGCGRGTNGLSVLKTMYKSARKRSHKKGRPFELSIEQFGKIASRPCHYCGTLPTERVASSRGIPLVTNGIDRYDNDEGYTLENSVPCCKECNMMKHTMSADEFMKHCRRIVKYNDMGE